VKVTHLRRFGCPKSGSPRLIHDEPDLPWYAGVEVLITVQLCTDQGS
jgi:hypothetical protein